MARAIGRRCLESECQPDQQPPTAHSPQPLLTELACPAQQPEVIDCRGPDRSAVRFATVLIDGHHGVGALVRVDSQDDHGHIAFALREQGPAGGHIPVGATPRSSQATPAGSLRSRGPPNGREPRRQTAAERTRETPHTLTLGSPAAHRRRSDTPSCDAVLLPSWALLSCMPCSPCVTATGCHVGVHAWSGWVGVARFRVVAMGSGYRLIKASRGRGLPAPLCIPTEWARSRISPTPKSEEP
jgi:hypothetical protein